MAYFLLIDDEEVFNFIHNQVITTVHPAARVIEFQSGSEAIDHLRRHASVADQLPDFIFVDINMPETTGFEFLERLQNELSALVRRPNVYMVTSSLFESDREKAATYPALTGFLEKPISADTIRQMIQSLPTANPF